MSGTLFYLIGASGSGKDSLLEGCRAQLKIDDRICVAHRYITRAPGIGGENHVHLSEAEFALRIELGMFAMHWDSHGYRYGIGAEVDHWLDAGANVVINGSREYLPVALGLYDELVPILVDVPAERLRARLTTRGRETAAEIERRLARHEAMVAALPPDVLKISNDGPLEAGVAALVALLRQHSWLPTDHSG